MNRPLVLVFGAALVLSSQAASAKPKVALTPIDGDATGDVRDAVVEALEGKELSLIGSREVSRAVDKLGDVSDLTERDFKKLASELEADAVVAGKLDKVGRSRTLKFRLFVHKKMAKGFTVSFKNAKSEKFRSMLHDKMIDKLGVSGGDADDERPRKKAGEAGEDDEDAARKDRKLAKRSRDDDDARSRRSRAGDDEDRQAKKPRVVDDDGRPAKKARGADDDERAARKASADDDERPARKASAAGDDDARAAGDDERPAPRGDGDDAPRKAKKRVATGEDGDELEASATARVEPRRAANRFAVRLDVGVSVLQRAFLFRTTSFPDAPKGATLSPVPGARFETELYPLAFGNPSRAAAGFGLGIEYDRTIKLNISSSNEPGVAVPVKQSHYSIGARYRIVFGRTETSPTLTLGVGYGKRLFSPDRSALTMDVSRADILRDTPASHYTVIDPGLMFRFPVTRMVALSAGGRGLIVTDAGQIQSLDSYGRARVYGGQGVAALDVVLGNRFALRFAGEFVQIGFAFTGDGTLSHDKDVAGLADRSIGGSATLAVMY